MAAAAWIEVAQEKVTRVALRLGLNYSSVITGMATIEDLCTIDKALRQQRAEAVALAQSVLLTIQAEARS